MLKKAGDSAYADLLRYYSVDMQGLFTSPPKLSPRRALALIQNLPMESATSAALRDSEDSIGWDTSTYLLASLVDSVRDGTFASIQMKTKKKLKPPERIKIPGVVVEKKPNSFVQAAQRFLTKQGE